MTKREYDNLSLGARGEELARQYLQNNGYKIITCNYKVKLGEIDIIAEDGADLVFVEVKARSGSAFGAPAEAVTFRKQMQIIRVAQYYLGNQGCFDRPARFDVVSVLIQNGIKPEIELIQNAFELP